MAQMLSLLLFFSVMFLFSFFVYKLPSLAVPSSVPGAFHSSQQKSCCEGQILPPLQRLSRPQLLLLRDLLQQPQPKAQSTQVEGGCHSLARHVAPRTNSQAQVPEAPQCQQCGEFPRFSRGLNN